MHRRHFLSAAAGAAFLTPTLAHAQMGGQPNTPAADLPPLKFSPAVRTRLMEVMRAHAPGGHLHDPRRRPYAVFDWDNTSIMNDCEETLLLTTIETFGFRMAPADFSRVLRAGITASKLAPDYKNVTGIAVSFDDLAADIEADYAALAETYGVPAKPESYGALARDARMASLRSKLFFAYNAITDTFGETLSDVWIVSLWAGATLAELQAAAEHNNDTTLGRAMQTLDLRTPDSRPGKAGIVSVSHLDGLRLTPEIATLHHTLRAYGIDVFVVSASCEDIVRVFATHPKYGYGVAPRNVLGIRMDYPGGTLGPTKAADWPVTLGPGKVEAIRRVMVAERGHGPLMVFGDSDGDYNMLKEFEDTQVSVIVNRVKGGAIGELSTIAAREITREAPPRFMLQGRNENTGEWRPAPTTVRMGAKSEDLVKG